MARCDRGSAFQEIVDCMEVHWSQGIDFWYNGYWTVRRKA